VRVVIAEVVEPRQLLVVVEAYVAHRTVPLLADDDFGDVLRRASVLERLDLVVFRAVYEHHDVGILFDGPRFTKVGEHRTFVRTLLERTVQL